MSKLLDIINDIIHVPKCAGCGIRMSSMGNGICEECYDAYLDETREYCDLCDFPAELCTCVPHNLLIKGCIDYRKLFFYRKEPQSAKVRNMIFSVKKSNNKHIIRFFSKELLKFEKGVKFNDAIVTYSPRVHSSINKYGYDHGKLLAKEYAKAGGYTFEALFVRKKKIGQAQQKSMDYRHRLSNMKGVFTLKDESHVKGKHIIIIDDVVTSGATLGECVGALYNAGARSVTCRSIAYTYRKNKRKND